MVVAVELAATGSASRDGDGTENNGIEEKGNKVECSERETERERRRELGKSRDENRKEEGRR